MTALQIIATYLVTVPIFFIIDIAWIVGVANSFYRSQIGFIMGPVNWPAAIAFYFIYIAGILIFAIYPALMEGSLQKALLFGALFGFFTYVTYDFTNWATLRDWPMLMVVVDVAWGTVLSASVAAGSYLVATRFIL